MLKAVTGTRIGRWASSCLAVLLLAGGAAAQVPTDELLPTNTVGYLSIRDYATFEAKWQQTRFGAMARDPAMTGFVEDLQNQFKARLDESGVRIGLKFDDLVKVCGGEVCIGTIEPDDAAQKHAIALLVDVTGKQSEVEQLLAQIDENMSQRNAVKTTAERAPITMTVYEVPVRRGARMSFNVALFVHQNQLVATDHMGVAQQLADRLAGKSGPSLSTVEAYRETLARCAKEAGEAPPDIVAFFEPLGYARVSREALGNRRPRRTDLIQALQQQGFDALQGMGGMVHLATGPHDAEFRAFVYAPGMPAAGGQRFRLAARVMNFAGSGQLAPQDWVPANVSSYHSALWDLKGAYPYVGSLVDEVAGQEGFWDDFITSLREDPNGPMIDLEKDFVAHLGDRVTLFTDVMEPIGPQSERLMVAIDLSNPEKMAASVNRMMKNDPATERHELEGHIIWEIIPEEEEDFEIALTEEDFVAFNDAEFGGEEPGAEQEAAPLLSSAAISVVHGQLIISSHVDYIMDIIQYDQQAPGLAQEPDFQQIEQSLAGLGASDNDTARSFSRLNELTRTSYELLRQGKMPESEGLLGQALNRLFASEKAGEPRAQQIDGKSLPPFEQVEKYFGPGGAFVRTEADGWYLAGAFVAGEGAPAPPEDAPQEAPTSLSTAAAEGDEPK